MSYFPNSFFSKYIHIFRLSLKNLTFSFSDAIVFFLLFILPFIIAPFGITQFENPKVIIGEAGVLLLLILSVFLTKPSFHYPRRQLLLYFAIIIITIIDIFFFRTHLSFLGNGFRMQGIYLFWFLLLFSLLSAKSSLKNIPWIVYGLLLLIEFIVLFFLPLNESQRYVGTLGEPNALAAFIIFLWPFAFYAIKKFTIREKIGSSLILVIVVAILFLTASRSAAIAFALQILFISLTKYRFSLAKSVLVCVILYMISYAFPFFEHVPYENRGEVWKSALAAGSTHPLLGYGFGNTETALHATAVRLGLPIQYYYVDSAHNIFLDWWVQGGVIGVTLLLTLIYFTINEFIKHNKKREIVLLIGMITTLSFNPASVVGLFGFWWIIGQGLKK